MRITQELSVLEQLILIIEAKFVIVVAGKYIREAENLVTKLKSEMERECKNMKMFMERWCKLGTKYEKLMEKNSKLEKEHKTLQQNHEKLVAENNKLLNESKTLHSDVKSNLFQNIRFGPTKFLLELLTLICQDLVKNLYQHYVLLSRKRTTT